MHGEKITPDIFFAIKQISGSNKSAPQTSAADVNKTLTNESLQIAQKINLFAASRAALIHRRHFLREQLADIAAALDAKPAESRQLGQKRHYGDLTKAVKQVLKSGALGKREILRRLQAMDLLTESHPLKVLDSVIYTPHFERDGKLFSLAKPIV